MEVTPEDAAVCERFGVEPVPAAAELKVGISRDVQRGVRPIRAIRHDVVGDTTGWYIWGRRGSGSGRRLLRSAPCRAPSEWCPELEPYLALPPGWGVVVASGYEDVWFDPSYSTD